MTTVDDSDTPWQRWRMRPALSIDWHTLLEEDLVAHFVVHPNYQEDESMHRETLENLGSSPFAQKHVGIELATEARKGSALKTKPSVQRGADHTTGVRTESCGGPDRGRVHSPASGGIP